MTFLSLLLTSLGLWTLAFGIGFNDPWLYAPGAIAVLSGFGLMWLSMESETAQLEERDWEWPVASSDGENGRTLRRAEAYRKHYFETDERDAA